ncbi:hypothetical protein CCB80_04620 [Armatimonadetes bacterium Uphvl-Ar1]|nr:hypothetical protein CCB80_04620 [Armatimonadetes bacterium Uphvl-Ar1]
MDRTQPGYINSPPIDDRNYLYEVWLEVNGYPRKKHPGHWQDFYNTPLHKRSIAADIGLYIIVSMISILALLSFPFAEFPAFFIGIVAMFFGTIWITPFLLPTEVPIQAVGILSIISQGYGHRYVSETVDPPSINDVNLYDIEVLARAAERKVTPVLHGLTESMYALQVSIESQAREVKTIQSLMVDVREQLTSDDRTWINILQPKLDRLEALEKIAVEQLEQLTSSFNILKSQSEKLQSDVNILKQRASIIERLELINERDDSELDIPVAFEHLSASLADTESQIAEANKIASAHESAKHEIENLLN